MASDSGASGTSKVLSALGALLFAGLIILPSWPIWVGLFAVVGALYLVASGLSWLVGDEGKVEPLPAPPPTGWEATDEFLEDSRWRRLRYKVLRDRGARCECCGATERDGRRMNVDHIKPRKLHPELALDEDNLQVLCDECNHGKGNWDQTDWRRRQA